MGSILARALNNPHPNNQHCQDDRKEQLFRHSAILCSCLWRPVNSSQNRAVQQVDDQAHRLRRWPLRRSAPGPTGVLHRARIGASAARVRGLCSTGVGSSSARVTDLGSTRIRLGFIMRDRSSVSDESNSRSPPREASTYGLERRENSMSPAGLGELLPRSTEDTG